MALTCFPLCKFIHCLYICIYVNFESHTLNFVTSLCYIYITDIYVCMYVCLSSHLSANVRYFLTGCTSSSHVYKFKTNHIDYIYIYCAMTSMHINVTMEMILKYFDSFSDKIHGYL